MLNYFRFKEFEGKVLITNDTGNYSFLSKEYFDDLLHDRIGRNHPMFEELHEKYFIYDEDQEIFLQRILESSRTSRSYLFFPTSLFIFVLSGQCNMNCVYCQAGSPRIIGKGRMDIETARKAVDIIFQSPAKYVNIEYQGGEPLLNFELVRFITEYAEEKAAGNGVTADFSVVTNLTLLTDEMVNFIAEHQINVSTSLDGNAVIHNANRPFRNGGGTYENVCEKIKKLTDRGVTAGAIETTTRSALQNPEEVVQAYADLGLESIFLRPLTKLGIAKDRWDEIGYTAEEFIAFYRKALQEIIRLNLNGYSMAEGHARIFLIKMIYGESANYMELRSPCGAGLGQMAFYYDGKVYTCDEARMVAEMGDDAFMMGTVDSTYDELIESDACKAAASASLLESLPECTDCVYLPYCGTCPVINYASEGDIFMRESFNYRCKIYAGMIETLFGLLKNGTDETKEILRRWAGE